MTSRTSVGFRVGSRLLLLAIMEARLLVKEINLQCPRLLDGSRFVPAANAVVANGTSTLVKVVYTQ